MITSIMLPILSFAFELTLVLEGVKASMLCKVSCTSSPYGGVYEENAQSSGASLDTSES